MINSDAFINYLFKDGLEFISNLELEGWRYLFPELGGPDEGGHGSTSHSSATLTSSLIASRLSLLLAVAVAGRGRVEASVVASSGIRKNMEPR